MKIYYTKSSKKASTKFMFTIFMMSLSFLSLAQQKFNYSGISNFKLIKEKADVFFKNTEKLKLNTFAKEPEDNDLFRYKRWEWFWKNRVLPDGSFPDLMEQNRTYKKLQSAYHSKNSSTAPAWVNISQTSTTGGYNGMGRLTSIAFHPTNQYIFWVGAPIGGIWKTIDGGQTYTALGDNLPYCSVGNILVDPTNPDIIYITIGDHGGWWNYGLGVYKTIDGGLTWTPTSLVTNFSAGTAYYAMAMSPGNSNVILVANTSGLYRTDNGGTTWTMVHTGSHRDIKFAVNDSSTVFVSTDDYWGSSEVFKSTDGGVSYSAISTFNTPKNRIQLCVTPADPNILGILTTDGTDKNYYNSTNKGASINLISTVPEDAIIFISPVNANRIYTGYTKVFRSTNSGVTWTQQTMWYDDGIHAEVHADEHFVASNPLNNKIYFCNDGGLYALSETTNSWTELNNTLTITQFYTISVSQSNPVFMIGGTQDNGGRKRIGANFWAATNGGDAMETAIDETNNQTIYTTYVNGQLYRSLDQWYNDKYHDITPPGSSGNWVTPYVLDPNNQSTIIAGYEDVYKSVDKGDTWTKISNNLTGSPNDRLDQIEVAPANSNVIYAARSNNFYATTNGGTNWFSYTLPFANSNFSGITSIAINPVSPNIVYVTVGGYSNGIKVFKSIDNGVNWTNESGALPNIPVSASIYDKNSSNHELYIGTDVGVFYINDFNNTWTYFGTNMPNTAVSDLKIQYSTGKLRAATYGRGIWETDLYSTISSGVQSNNSNTENKFSNAFNPVNNLIFINALISKDVNATLQIFDLAGKLLYSAPKHFQQGNYQVPVDISFLPAGIFIMRIDSGSEKTNFKIVHVLVN